MSKRVRMWALIVLGVGAAVALVVRHWPSGAGDVVQGTGPASRALSLQEIAARQGSGKAEFLARAAREEKDPSVRQTALLLLAPLASAPHRATVETCLKDTADEVRYAAALAVGHYGDEAGADQLGQVLCGDEKPLVKLGAVIGLGRNKHSKAIVWLITGLEQPQDPQVHLRVIQELYQKFGMGYEGAGPADPHTWPDQVGLVTEYLKTYPQVKQAFAAAGQAIRHDPRYQRTPSHPH